MQIAFALRDEVADLEAAGAKMIQMDEPALQEGFPLKPERWNSYLSWAADAFPLATSFANMVKVAQTLRQEIESKAKS